MHLTQKGYCFGVLLLHTITTITSPSVARCEPGLQSPRLTLHGDRSRVLLTTTGLLAHPPSRERRKRLREGPRNPPHSRSLDNRDAAPTGTSGRRPGQTLSPRMATNSTDESFKGRGEPKRTEGGWMYTSLSPTNDDCSRGDIKRLTQGKVYIPEVGYQSESAVSVQALGGQKRVKGQQRSGSVKTWHKLQPVVECGDEAMTLTVRRRRAVQLLLDRVNESSVPLSQLPPQCGYSVQTSWRDLSFTARYDACYVTHEDDCYVLPLLWRGTPVKISCPVFHIQPQAVGPSSLCCSPYGMTVNVPGLSAAEELRVKVAGEWTPLVVSAEQCGYTLNRQDAEIVIAAPFITCGITVKGGKHTLSFQMGEKTFTLTCPVSPTEEPPLTHQPLDNSPHLSRGSTEDLGSFPWAPPFYLAPPYYPHPTYHHRYPSPDGHDAYDPPIPSPSTTFGPQPLPPVDSQLDYRDYYSHQIPVRESYKYFGVHSSRPSTGNLEDSSRLYPDLQQNQEAPVLGLSEKHSATHSPSSGFPFQVEAPPLHAFNQYYRYYSHPKIPLPGPPQDPDPRPEFPRGLSLTNPNNTEFPELRPSVQQSKALSRVNLDQFLQSVPEAASHPSSLPISPEFVHKASVPYTPYPPQHYPYHYFYYFPHIVRGEVRRLAPLNPDTAAKSNLSDYQNSKSSTSSEVPDKYNFNPHTDQPNPGNMINHQKNRQEWIKPPLLSDDDAKAQLDDTKMQSGVQPPLPPGYHLGPDTVAVAPPKQSSSPTPWPNHNLPVYPYYHHPYYYYYYHLYYQPEVTVDNQQLHPAGSMTSEKTSSKSEPQLTLDSDHSRMDWLVHAAEARYPSILLQHPYDPFGHPNGEEAEEVLDEELKDHLEANLYTSSASPCGLGSMSDFDFSVSLGCCSYPVKDCTMGQHLIFVVPYSVVAPPDDPSEVSNVSCTLQRLTSDPDLYIVPLDGCRVNEHVLGQTVVGIHSLQQDHSSVQDNAVRLMVECSSSPGSSGEVRLHVIKQPSPPPIQSTSAIVTVQLRIATDESFSSFHPEAHLTLSLMRGKPVYVEVSLLDPPEPGLVLLVHSCLAYTRAPYISWMLVYDGCSSQGGLQQLPSPHSDSHHIRRINISSFLSLPSESPSYVAKGGYTHLEDQEIYFLCLAEVCSAADGDCTLGCLNRKFNTVERKEKLKNVLVVLSGD